MIEWKYGLSKAPDDNRVRQIPTKHVWSSSLWISKDGVCWRRFFNPITQTWKREEKPHAYTFDKDGTRIGLLLLDQWTPLETCILLAWKHRLPGAPTRTVLEPGFPIHADHLSWTEPGTNDEGDYSEEVFAPLKWRCGIRNCPESYQISRRGVLRSPTGAMTRGFYFADSMWAAVKNCGLVNLLQAAGIQPSVPRIRPYLRLAVDAIMTSHTPTDLSREAGVTLSTAWSYFTQAAPFLASSDLQRVGPNLVSRDVWHVLHELQSEKDARLGGSLKELLPVVEERLAKESDFHQNTYQLSELRFARLCIVGTCSSLGVCGR